MPSFTRVFAFSLLSAMAISAPLNNDSSRSHSHPPAMHTVGGSPPKERFAGALFANEHRVNPSGHMISSMDKRDQRKAKPTSTRSHSSHTQSTHSHEHHSESTHSLKDHSRTEEHSRPTGTKHPDKGHEDEKHNRHSSHAPKATPA